LNFLQRIEELVGVTFCDKDILDDIVNKIYSSHLATHYIYGFDRLCQTLNQDMTSSILHFRFFGSRTWAQIPIYCLYDPSSSNAIFDGVSILGPLGWFPLPLSKDSSTDLHMGRV
jgi:hypothetical protein